MSIRTKSHRRLVVEKLENRRVLSVTFIDSGQTLVGGECPNLGDLDADGDLDAFVVSNGTIRILINDGTGEFVDSGQALGSLMQCEARLGDLDGDGDLDGLVSNSNGFQPWLNNGHGVFTSADLQNEGGVTKDFSLGDLDGDGDLDAVALNDELRLGIMLNDGTGRFQESGQHLGRCGTFVGCAMGFGDFDGDTDLDVLVASVIWGDDFVWINDGSGDFSPRSQDVLKTFRDTHSVVEVGDLDGDGDLDVVFAGNTSNAGRFGPPPLTGILFNDGNANFTYSGQTLSEPFTDNKANDVALGDLDGDRDIDILVRYPTSLQVWVNDGRGNFSIGGHVPPNESFSGNPHIRNLSLGDLDGDGDLDALLFGKDGGRIWLNQGIPGDSNHDGVINQLDIDHVLQANKYLSDDPATFEEGDWNGDGVFDQLDVVSALQTGNYLQRPNAADAAFAAIGG